MEKALAEKLGIPLATVEAQFDAGKTLYQIALDNGIAQADLPAFMLEVRSKAIKAALADGVITQAQADRMLKAGGRGMGFGGRGLGIGMMRGGFGNGSCDGTGIRARYRHAARRIRLARQPVIHHASEYKTAAALRRLLFFFPV